MTEIAASIRLILAAAITPVKCVGLTSKSRNRLCFPIGCCNREEFLEVHTLLKESEKVKSGNFTLIFATSLHLAVEMHTKLLDGALDFAGS